MSFKVIELNDRAINIGDETGILLQSPGFALADDRELILGELAEQQARLQPTRSYNKYWHKLSLDPIDHGNSFRHHADIAFAHLQHLAEAAEVVSDVVVAVPGSFTRQQLSILLGLTQHSPFQVTGVVDSALAATLATARSRNILYADIQLHQVVVTRLSIDGTRVHAGSAVQIPGVGSQDFMDLMMQLATAMFIQQCRFNPQHNADSEQQLYNELPGWLAQAQDGNLILELNAGDTVHTARMPMDSLINSLNSLFRQINEQISAMATEHDTQLVLSTALAQLPGFRASLPQTHDLVVVDDGAVNAACIKYRDLIDTGDDGIKLVKSLPLPSATVAQVSAPIRQASLPTHLLYGSMALPVKKIRIENQQSLNGNARLPGVLALSIAELPASLGKLDLRNDGVYFDSGELQFFLNGEASLGEHRLATGDRIQFTGSDEVLTLIQVQDG